MRVLWTLGRVLKAERNELEAWLGPVEITMTDLRNIKITDDVKAVVLSPVVLPKREMLKLARKHRFLILQPIYVILHYDETERCTEFNKSTDYIFEYLKCGDRLYNPRFFDPRSVKEPVRRVYIHVRFVTFINIRGVRKNKCVYDFLNKEWGALLDTLWYFVNRAKGNCIYIKYKDVARFCIKRELALPEPQKLHKLMRAFNVERDRVFVRGHKVTWILRRDNPLWTLLKRRRFLEVLCELKKSFPNSI